MLTGTIFEINMQTNNYTDVHNFDITHNNLPQSGLVEGPNGLLYGTTSYGGINNKGVLYSFDPVSNTYTDLFDFVNITGAIPFYVPIVINTKLYGIASEGGPFNNNAGAIYSYDLLTNTYTDLFDFNGTTDGSSPYGGLVLANDGKIYGNTLDGGANNKGVIFRFDPSTSAYQKLYDFDMLTGGTPMGALMQASNNKLYGTASAGGVHSMGTLFSFDIASNSYSDLFDFDSINGTMPIANLIQLSNGLLYGATLTAPFIIYISYVLPDYKNNFSPYYLSTLSLRGPPAV